MISHLLTALVPIALILVMSEVFWRHKWIKGEKARKFIHILAGTWMALWPLYIPFDGIFILGSVALTVLLYSRFTRLFHAIYAVKRKTYGEIFFALAIMMVAFIAKQPWIFTVSILLLALADGGAAVVGRYFGKNNRYYVLKKDYLQKSVVGTVAYIVLAYLSVGIGLLYASAANVGIDFDTQASVVLFCLVPLGSALVENFTPFGLDNLVTPIFAALLLNSLV